MGRWTDPNFVCSLAAGILLAVNSMNDLMKHEIFLLPTVAAGVCGAVLRIAGKMTGPAELMAASLPGLMLIIFSFLTAGKVGSGDGILFLALAMWTDSVTMLLTFSASLAVAAACGTIQGLTGHEKGNFAKKREIPFVPCIFAAFLMTVLFL